MSALLIVAAGAIWILGMYLWYFHCLFRWHKWDRSRRVADVCLRCGAMRFKR
jgi:hypothetical protein